jgi:hypothetical protein
MRAGRLRTRVTLLASAPMPTPDGAIDPVETTLGDVWAEWVQPTGGLLVAVTGGARAVTDVASHVVRMRAGAVGDANAVRVIRRRSDGLRLRVERWRALDQVRDAVEFLCSLEGTV